jgi:uncharacterized damage-inducible protein DinB
MIQAAVKSTTALEDFMKSFATYNAWANRTLVNWLKTKPADAMSREIASSFPSIKETVVHIWDTQRFWLSVLQQKPAPVSFRMEGFHGSLEDAFEGIVQQSDEFANYIDSLTDASLQEVVSFDSPWVAGKAPRTDYLLQVFNHSTYHRGQVVTIGRNVGLTDAPMTDYNFYLLYGKQ